MSSPPAFIIPCDMFIDLGRKFEIFIDIAGVRVFWIRANGEGLFLLPFENPLMPWRVIVLALYLERKERASWAVIPGFCWSSAIKSDSDRKCRATMAKTSHVSAKEH